MTERAEDCFLQTPGSAWIGIWRGDIGICRFQCLRYGANSRALNFLFRHRPRASAWIRRKQMWKLQPPVDPCWVEAGGLSLWSLVEPGGSGIVRHLRRPHRRPSERRNCSNGLTVGPRLVRRTMPESLIPLPSPMLPSMHFLARLQKRHLPSNRCWGSGATSIAASGP